MTIHRRHLLQTLPGLLAFGTAGARAQAWPERPIRIVVGYPAGQTADLNARQFAAAMARELGQPVFVENRPGANGLLGAQEARQSKPDGYTLLWGGSGPLAINPALYPKTPYDPLRDFQPVCLTTLGSLYLIAHPSFPASDLKGLLALARAKPGALDYATAGNGSTAHLAMKLLEADTGAQLHHVPYKGSPAALTDLIGGQIPLMMEAGTAAMPTIRSGKVKALGMTGRQRSTQMPNVPTLAEQGMAGFEAYAWNAIVAPAGTPQAIVGRVSEAVRKSLEDPATVAALQASGTQYAWMPPAEFDAFLRAEIRKWARAVELSGAQLD